MAFHTPEVTKKIYLLNKYAILLFSSPEHCAHGGLLWSVNVHCPSWVVRRVASAIALKAFSSYISVPVD